MRRHWIRNGMVVGLLLAPMIATAARLQIETTVTRTLASDETGFGSCMARLRVSPAAEGLDCQPGYWVTFDCVGKYVSRSSAARMFDSAQLAFLMGKRVRLTVDDSRKHNGWCLVQRIELLADDAEAAADVEPDEPQVVGGEAARQPETADAVPSS